MPSHVECWRGCRLPHSSNVHDMVCLLNLLRKWSFGDVPERLGLPLGLSFFPSPSLRAVLCVPGAAVSALVLVVSCVRGETQTQDKGQQNQEGLSHSGLQVLPPAAGPAREARMCVGGASLRPRVLTGVYRKLSVVRPWVWLMRSSWMTGQCVTAYVVLNVTAGSPELGGRLPFVVHVVVLRLFCGDRGRCEVNVEHSVADVGSGWAGYS